MRDNPNALKRVFHDAFYFEMNDDVKNQGMDPFEHYVAHGYGEGRKPSNIINIEYFLKNRVPESKKDLTLDEVSDLLEGVEWCDDFSFHPLLCPSWLGMQLPDVRERYSLVDALSVALSNDRISLHPGLKAVSVSEGRTLAAILNDLHYKDAGELSIIDLSLIHISEPTRPY